MTVIGYTTGVFDMFHVGHLNLLRRARADCDQLIVGVTTDELCLQRKNRAPVIPYSERAEIVGSIRYVDRVLPQGDMDKYRAWQELQFDKMFVGDDWKGSAFWIELEARFAPEGVEIVYLPYTSHISTTSLRNRLAGGTGGS